MDEVWLVTRKGVYDQGVEFVATSREDAVEFAMRYAPDADGYHSWEISKVPVGRPVQAVRTEAPERRCNHSGLFLRSAVGTPVNYDVDN